MQIIQSFRSGFLNTHLIELFKNHKLVKIFQREEYESKRTDEHLDQLKDKNIPMVLFGMKEKVANTFSILGLADLLHIKQNKQEAKSLANELSV